MPRLALLWLTALTAVSAWGQPCSYTVKAEGLTIGPDGAGGSVRSDGEAFRLDGVGTGLPPCRDGRQRREPQQSQSRHGGSPVPTPSRRKASPSDRTV